MGLVDSDGDNARSLNFADEVPDLRDICRAFDKASELPIAGAPAALTFNEEIQADLLLLGDVIALRAMDAASR